MNEHAIGFVTGLVLAILVVGMVTTSILIQKKW